jgi:hypothetical protein
MLSFISFGIQFALAAGLLFFGLGSLSSPSTWHFRPALFDAFLSTILGLVVLAVGILDYSL